MTGAQVSADRLLPNVRLAAEIDPLATAREFGKGLRSQAPGGKLMILAALVRQMLEDQPDLSDRILRELIRLTREGPDYEAMIAAPEPAEAA